MDERDIAIAELKKEVKSLEHRMNDVEKIVEVIHHLAQEMVGLNKEVSFMNNNIAQLTSKVSNLEQAPGKRWEGFVGALIGAIAGAIGSMMFK